MNLTDRFWAYLADKIVARMHIEPEKDNAFDLGRAAYRWRKLYLADSSAIPTDTDTYNDSVAKNLGTDADGGVRLDHGEFGNVTGAVEGQIFTTGSIMIGNVANTFMTIGLSLKQGAADDEILALKSSDVAHGMSAYTETDTYAAFSKASAAAGGLYVKGLSETTIGLYLRGLHTTDDTTKSISGVGAVVIEGTLKSGTGGTSLGANANILAALNNGATQFILDADGDSHQNVGTAWTNFDEFDDPALLTALAVGVSRPDDPIRREFGQYLEAHREPLERAKLVTFNEDGCHFVNMSRLTMLLVGALRQVAGRTARLEATVERLQLTAPQSAP